MTNFIDQFLYLFFFRPLQRVQKAALRDQEEVGGVLAAAEEEQEEQDVRVGAEGGRRVGAGRGEAVQGWSWVNSTLIHRVTIQVVPWV